MAHCSGNILEEQVVSDATEISSQKQLVNQVHRSLHGEIGKHPGISKTLVAYRESFFSKMGAIEQGEGYVMPAMHQRTTN